MSRTLNFPSCTSFLFDEKNADLELISLFGLSCGTAESEKNYINSGLAVICADEKRYEWKKLKYKIIEATENSFCFDITDENNSISLECRWCFEAQYQLISCKYTLVNLSGSPQKVRRILPRFSFAPGKYNFHYQESRWMAENLPRKTELAGANIVLHGAAARSSVGNTPFCILEDTENHSAAAFHVVPRGNWCIKANAAIMHNGCAMPVIEAGLSDNDLFAEIAPQQRFELPEIIITKVPMCDPGLAGAALQRYMIDCRLPENLHTPPVVYNSWLYRMTDFTKEELSSQLQTAKKLGCEVFIVDAGWFGSDDWWEDAGNWQEKTGAPFYGNMTSFADEVRSHGLDFGFWMEPERFAGNAPVRKEHPEWFPEHSLRIDLTQNEAAEFFKKMISDNVRKFKAKYIKIDFNTDMGYDESGNELHGYSSALYKILSELRNEFPELVIENCGSGALRNDLATALLFDLAFISDNASLFENLKIRQGTLARTLPGRILNWVVTRPAPEDITKMTKLPLVLGCTSATWQEAALFNVDFIMTSSLLGIPGFSGDIAGLPDNICQRYAEYVTFYKKHRKFFVDSHVYQLNMSYTPTMDYENFLAFQMQNKERNKSLVFAFSSGLSRRDSRRFKLFDLQANKTYRITKLFCESANTVTASGQELLEYGIECSIVNSNFTRHAAAIYEVTEI